MWRFLACTIALLTVTACSDSGAPPTEGAADAQSTAVSDTSPADNVSTAAEEPTTYGVTDFEATGSAEAYPVFLRGLLQLHNFEFEDSRETFREAQEIDPDFYMAYWGEALTQKQPLWNREDLAAGRAALAKLAPTPEEQLALAPTERERAYMAAAHRLFSEEGTELEIETDYAEMLGEIYARWPDDLDAGAFYALAILTTSHDGREFDKFMRAAAVTEESPRQEPAPSRRPALQHPQLRRPDTRAAGAALGPRLRQRGAGRRACAAHAVAHLPRARRFRGHARPQSARLRCFHRPPGPSRRHAGPQRGVSHA